MKYFYSFDEFSIPYWIRVLYWGLYMTVFVYAVWKTLLSTPKFKQQKEVTGLFAVFFALYAVFYCINPDYFRYREWLNVTGIDFWVKEKFYIYTVLFCRSLPFDYPFEVFRLIVWGGAVFIAYYSFRMYRGLLLPGFTLLLLFVFNAGTFCYARASLAMAIYFFGIAFFLLHNGKIFKLLGIGIALSSFYFHRELLIGIVILPCLYIPFERKSISFISILLLLFAIIAIYFVSSNLQFLDEMFDNDDISSKIEEFSDKGQGAIRISTIIGYLKYFYPFYLLMKIFWRKRVPNSVIGIYRITYGILMASVAFMVVFGLRSIYAYRVMYITMIPLAFLTAYGYYQRYFTKKQFLIMMILAVISSSVRFINAQ